MVGTSNQSVPEMAIELLSPIVCIGLWVEVVRLGKTQGRIVESG